MQYYFLVSYPRSIQENALVFWLETKCGYTTDYRKAGVFSEDEAKPHVSKTTRMMPIVALDDMMNRVVIDLRDEFNMEKLNRLMEDSNATG